MHRTINTGIIKRDTSNHFPIFLIAEAEKTTPEGKVQITKCLINKTKEKFKNALQKMTQDDAVSSKQTGYTCEALLH